MPDSISHKSMKRGIACSVLFSLFVCLLFCIYLLSAFLRGHTSVFLRLKEMESVFSL